MPIGSATLVGALAGVSTVALAGAAVLVATGAATAGGSPYSIAEATTTTLSSWGLTVHLQEDLIYIEAAAGSYAVAMVDTVAYAPTVFPPIAAGSTTSVVVPVAGGSQAGEPWVREIGPSLAAAVSVPAHSSYWPGSTVAGGTSVAEWVTDWSTSEIPGELATDAGRLGHNPATYSDCTAAACGFWVSPATLSTVGGVPILTATADSIFVAVTDDRSTWTAPWPDETAWTVSATGLRGTSRVPSGDGSSVAVTEVTITGGSALGTMYPTVDAPSSPGDPANGVPANSVPVLLTAGANGYYSVHSGNPIRTTVVSSTEAVAPTPTPTPASTTTPGVSPAPTPTATPSAASTADPTTTESGTSTPAVSAADVLAAPQRVVFQTGEGTPIARPATRSTPAPGEPARSGLAGVLGALSLTCAVVALRSVRASRRPT